MADNTPGLDGATVADLQLASPAALDWLAKMLNGIEEGKPWPAQITAARNSFLSKGNDELDPMDYRALSILSEVYTLYAGIPLQAIQGWIKGWTSDESFAGTCDPVGA